MKVISCIAIIELIIIFVLLLTSTGGVGCVVSDIVYQKDTIYVDNCTCPDCYEEVISKVAETKNFEITIKEMIEHE